MLRAELQGSQKMNDITIVHRPRIIGVINRPQIIEVEVHGPSAVNFVPFYFVAEQDQVEFTLALTPIALILLAINGEEKIQADGDFTVSKNKITLSEGINEGDRVFGVYQI